MFNVQVLIIMKKKTGTIRTFIFRCLKIFANVLQTDIFKRIEFDIPVYFRYVDDTFLLIPKDKIHYILTMFNSYHKRLQFTYELENNN